MTGPIKILNDDIRRLTKKNTQLNKILKNASDENWELRKENKKRLREVVKRGIVIEAFIKTLTLYKKDVEKAVYLKLLKIITDHLSEEN